MNKFHLRPAYGKKELLIEFISGPEKDSFIQELQEALSSLNTTIVGTQDLWVNDEIIFEIQCDLGLFQLSIDVWDCGFLSCKQEQHLITISSTLEENPNFEKLNADFKKYE